MATDNPPKIRAILRSIEVQITADLGNWNRSKYSVELSVDGKVISKSKTKSASSVLKWEWNRGNKISFKPLSIMKIVIYRGFGIPFNLGKASVAQYEGRVENLLDNIDASFELTDQQGAFLPAQMTIALSRVSASQDNPYVAIGGLPVVHPETSLDHAKEVGSVVYGAFKTITQALYDCSDMFLPLKTTAGAILTIIKVVEGVSNNKDELAQLKAKLVAIRLIVEKYQEHGGIGVINLRIKNFCDAIVLQLQKVEGLQNKSLLTRVALTTEDANAILKALRNIDGLCDVFQIDTQLRTEQIVNNISQLLDSNIIDKLYHEMTSYKTRQSSYGEATGCMEGTRTKVLEDLDVWALDPKGKRVYWMVGMAGIGKSTIAHTFCERLEAKNMLCGSFFASRSSDKTSNARLIIPVIAHSLASASPPIKIRVTKAIRDDPTLAEPTYGKMSEQFKQLISNPIESTAGVADKPYKVVVIDAVDECSKLEVVASFIKIILQSASKLRLKVFISSREESEFSDAFDTGDNEAKNFRLHDIERDVVQGDIRRYLEMSLTGIRGKNDHGWPPHSDLDGLVARSGTLFIYAATAVRYIASGGKLYKDRFSEMAEQGLESVIDFKTDIDNLYILILEMACKEKRAHEITRMRDLVSIIVFLRHPLRIQAIESLSAMDVSSNLSKLTSVIHIPDQLEPKAVVALFHASFPDFITNPERCSPERCPSFRSLDPSEGHKFLALRCLNVMNRSLKYNICEIAEESILSHKKRTNSLANASKISEALKYSCVYWATHLAEVKDFDPVFVNALRVFLHKHLLHWFECLSIIGELQTGVKSLGIIVPVLSEFKVDNLHLLVEDTRRCLQLNFEVVQKYCMEIYQSALVWLPKKSLLRNVYAQELRGMPKVILGLSDSWGATEFVLQHGSIVNAVALSPDGSRVVSGSHDSAVRIWNVSTGEVDVTLEGHTDPVTSVAFSPDGSQVVSGSLDTTIRIWNVTTGELETMLEGHIDSVKSAAFSPDGSRVVSGSNDKTVRIWNVTTGELETTLEAHTDDVMSVAFSPDGSRVVSGSRDETAQIWNVTTGKEETTLEGHGGWVMSVAFSPDGSQVVSSSNDQTVRIWNVTSGEEEITLEGHTNWVSSAAFSPDGSRVVSGSDDNTIRIWSATTGEVETTLEGHTRSVMSVKFSPDGSRIVSGSNDETVRIWDITTSETETTLEGHTSWVLSVAFSPDGSRVVSGSDDNTIRIWNINTGKVEITLEGHRHGVMSVSFSPDGSRVVSGSFDATVRIWNVTTGEEEATLEGHRREVTSVAFSLDSSRVVSASFDTTVRIWDLMTGKSERMTVPDLTLPDGSCVKRDGIQNFHIVYPLHKPQTPHNMNPTLQISDDAQWIMANFRHCWIPSQHRNTDTSCSTWGSKICWGCASGRIIVVDMSAAL